MGPIVPTTDPVELLNHPQLKEDLGQGLASWFLTVCLQNGSRNVTHLIKLKTSEQAGTQSVNECSVSHYYRKL